MNNLIFFFCLFSTFLAEDEFVPLVETGDVDKPYVSPFWPNRTIEAGESYTWTINLEGLYLFDPNNDSAIILRGKNVTDLNFEMRIEHKHKSSTTSVYNTWNATEKRLHTCDLHYDTYYIVCKNPNKSPIYVRYSISVEQNDAECPLDDLWKGIAKIIIMAICISLAICCCIAVCCFAGVFGTCVGGACLCCVKRNQNNNRNNNNHANQGNNNGALLPNNNNNNNNNNNYPAAQYHYNQQNQQQQPSYVPANNNYNQPQPYSPNNPAQNYYNQQPQYPQQPQQQPVNPAYNGYNPSYANQPTNYNSQQNYNVDDIRVVNNLGSLNADEGTRTTNTVNYNV